MLKKKTIMKAIKLHFYFYLKNKISVNIVKKSIQFISKLMNYFIFIGIKCLMFLHIKNNIKVHTANKFNLMFFLLIKN